MEPLPLIPDDPSVIRPTLDALRNSFHEGKTRPFNYRERQLRALLKGIEELTPKFEVALKKDLGVSPFMNYMLSIGITVNEIKDILKNFRKWARPIPADTSVPIGPGKSYVIPEPYGIALVMSAWNYPLFTLIPPAATAIAAGNCVVVKPSEMAPHTSKVVVELFEKYLDKDCFRVIEGQVEVAKAITREKFDVIVFTGSPEKGKLVAKAAAENLVPCVLELGGKNPTIVDRDANLDNAAMRIVSSRFINAGQTCIAPDYCFVHKDVKKEFLKKLKEYVIKFHGTDPSKDEHFPRIVNEFHTNRLKEYLEENHNGKVIIGGEVRVKDKYVSPTVIDSPKLDSKLMQDEIFGPILPVLEFTDISDVIKHIRNHEKPLALYYYGSIFGTNKQRIINETSSGAVMINDSLFHILNSTLPFGGVGHSGFGSCHGIWGFNSVSHLKPVMEKVSTNFFPYSVRFPPYTGGKQMLMKTIFKLNSVQQRHLLKGALFTVVMIAVALRVKADGVGKTTTMISEFFKKLGERMGKSQRGPKL